MERIPFNRPVLFGKEIEYILDAVGRAHISGDGHYTRLCHATLESHLGVQRALLCTSCTHALELTALLCNIGPGDEVILPSYTFVSTANAFALRGARLVFADIREDTLNLDESRLESLISERTRAIVAVHYAGVGCEMDAICQIAERHSIPVIEDNAHGLFGKYRGRWLGSFGALAALSFHETKNVTCGEGGALLINDPIYTERAEILREKGTDRARFFRRQVDKYSWVDLGSSYLPSDILAAFLYAQIEMAGTIQQRRERVWKYYFEAAREWAENVGVRLPYVPEHCQQAYHMFYILLPCLEDRQAMIADLTAQGITSVFHYVPLHRSAMGVKVSGGVAECPVTDSISDRLLRLPFWNGITESEQERVMNALKGFQAWRTRPVRFEGV